MVPNAVAGLPVAVKRVSITNLLEFSMRFIFLTLRTECDFRVIITDCGQLQIETQRIKILLVAQLSYRARLP